MSYEAILERLIGNCGVQIASGSSLQSFFATVAKEMAYQEAQREKYIEATFLFLANLKAKLEREEVVVPEEVELWRRELEEMLYSGDGHHFPQKSIEPF